MSADTPLHVGESRPPVQSSREETQADEPREAGAVTVVVLSERARQAPRHSQNKMLNPPIRVLPPAPTSLARGANVAELSVHCSLVDRPLPHAFPTVPQ